MIHPAKLYLDAGHGGVAAKKFGNNGDGRGAYGPQDSLSEQWVNLHVTFAVRDSILANFPYTEGIEFLLSRSSDTIQKSLFSRVEEANTAFGAEQFISVHHNGFPAGGSTPIQGTEVWWSDADTAKQGPFDGQPRDSLARERTLAEKLQYGLLWSMNHSIASCFGCYADRCWSKNHADPMAGCMSNTRTYVTFGNLIPSALTEASDISRHSDEEARFLNGSTHIDAEASGIYRSWFSYLTSQGFGYIDYDFVGELNSLYDTILTVGVGDPPLEPVRDYLVPYKRTWDLVNSPTTRTLDALSSFVHDGFSYEFYRWTKKDFSTGEIEELYPIGTSYFQITVQEDSSGYHYYVALYSGGDFQAFVISPSAGESEFVIGDTMSIKWFAPDGVARSDSIYLDLSRDAGTTWQNILGPVPYNAGQGNFNGESAWQIGGPVSDSCIIRVRARDIAGNGDTALSSPFAIGCAPAVSFVASANLGVVPFTVTFTDMSSFANNATRIWDFGDGVMDTTQASVIQHTYTTTGLKTVSLTVANTCGSNSITVTDLISATCIEQLSFSPHSPVVTLPPFELVFFYDSPVNLPPETQYIYDFGDGTIDTTLFASHTYTTKGVYDLTMTVNAACGNSVLKKPAFVTILCCDTPGDYDNDGKFDIADITAGINRIFSAGPPPFCQDEADANGDNAFNLPDVTYMIAAIFSGGPAPVC